MQVNRLHILALLVAVPAAAAPPRAVAAKPVLVIRNGPCEFEGALAQLGVPCRTTRDLGALSRLTPESASAVVVCALRYPEANRLTTAQQRGLEAFVSAGGHAYVEMTAGAGGGLFGMPAEAAPRRAYFERLVATGSHPVTEVLGEGALLEEHNSAYLPCTPPAGAIHILDYGKVLGTYRKHTSEPGLEVVLDLGQPVHTTRVVQRYGAAQPNYCPERVVIQTSGDGKSWQERHAAAGSPLLPNVLDIRLDAPDTRYVRFRITKYRRSRVTDFLFVGETQVLDEGGRNVALGKPYRLAPGPHPDYPDVGSALTDGTVEGHWSDHLSVGWATQEPLDTPSFSGLLEIRKGKGTALVALTKLSDFRARHYRLTTRWEDLARGIALHLLPEADRKKARERYLPLEAHTEPRRWQVPGKPVRLAVATAPGARVTAACAGLSLPAAREAGGGRLEIPFTAPEGDYRLRVRAERAGRTREVVVPLRVCGRPERYRRALDANIAWFRKSGVLPAPDGSLGVYSQRCMAWLDGAPWDGGPRDFLDNPQRLDCNAATAVAFWLAGEVSGDRECLSIARKIADSMLSHQFGDPMKASFGGWPWLYDKCNTIWFWDDNTRVAVALLWLYSKTGDARYLEAGLRTTELFRQVAQEDGCVARHAIAAEELDRLGRMAYRQYRQGLAVDFDLLRWSWAAGVTGDPIYGDLARTCARARGGNAWGKGLPFACRLTEDPALRERLTAMWRGYLAHPDVRKFGAQRAGGHDFRYAFVNDCSVGTEEGEPLTDQLYSVPAQLLHAWSAYKATGDAGCREAFERTADYLVRIQSEDSDPRLKGAWMRGFDLDAWEEYGAPYDPAYGPYSAYTGWMNSFAASGLALYLLDQSPFPPEQAAAEAQAVLARVRAQLPPDRVNAMNLALRRPYTVEPAPLPAYADKGGEMTDGMVDGAYADGLSAGWHLNDGETLTVTITLDLGEAVSLGMVAQRYGAGSATYTPDRVTVLASGDGKEFSPMAEARVGADPVGSVWIPLPDSPQARYLRFRLTKTRRGKADDFLFVGETMAFAARAGGGKP